MYYLFGAIVYILLLCILWKILYRIKLKKVTRLVIGYGSSFLLLVMMPAIMLVVVSIWILVAPEKQHKFDSTEWRTNIDNRYLMWGDLDKVLKGKTGEQVVELLGDSVYRVVPDTIFYCAGNKPSLMTFIPQILVITLDKGVVTKVIRTSTNHQLENKCYSNELEATKE